MSAAPQLAPARLPVDTAERTRVLRHAVTCGRGTPCARCGTAVSAHDVLMSIGAGFRTAALCLCCLSDELEQAPAALCHHLAEWFRRRACYDEAWAECTRLEGAEPRALETDAQDAALLAPARLRLGVDDPEPEPEHFWDAGQLGCGELVMELRLRLRSMAPREVLQVRALDPGAREDLPAWCAMTGHALVRAEHPQYDIRRKEQ